MDKCKVTYVDCDAVSTVIVNKASLGSVVMIADEKYVVVSDSTGMISSGSCNLFHLDSKTILTVGEECEVERTELYVLEIIISKKRVID